MAGLVFFMGMVLTFALVGGASAFIPAKLISGPNASPLTPTTTFYEVEAHQVASKLSVANNIRYAELFRPGDAMVGKSFNQVSYLLSKVGSPACFVRTGVMDQYGVFIYFMDSVAASKITTTPAWFTFRNDTAYTMQAGNRLGVTYQCGDASNYINVYSANTNPYGGTLAFKQWWNGTGWTGGNVEDLTMVVGATAVAPPADTTPPVVSILTPIEGATVKNPIVISGTSSDASGVKLVEYRTAYHNPTTNVDEFTAWTPATPSAPGNYATWTASLPSLTKLTYISVRATDNANNVGLDSVNVNFVPDSPTGDTEKPIVIILTPTTGQSIAASSIGVTGHASDNVGVTSLKYKIDANALAPIAISGTTFAFSILDTPVGSHVLTMQASDAKGNIGTATVSFTVTSTTPPPPPCDEGMHLDTTTNTCVPDDVPAPINLETVGLYGGGLLSGIASLFAYRRAS